MKNLKTRSLSIFGGMTLGALGALYGCDQNAREAEQVTRGAATTGLQPGDIAITCFDAVGRTIYRSSRWFRSRPATDIKFTDKEATTAGVFNGPTKTPTSHLRSPPTRRLDNRSTSRRAGVSDDHRIDLHLSGHRGRRRRRGDQRLAALGHDGLARWDVGCRRVPGRRRLGAAHRSCGRQRIAGPRRPDRI